MTPLRQRMSDDMQVRNLAPHTQRSYLQQVSQFARHFGKSPELLGPDDIRAYQLHLTRDQRLSASSILVAVAAIRFLYKARSQQLCHQPPFRAKARQMPENAQLACTMGRSGLLKRAVLSSFCHTHSSRIRQNSPSSDPGFAL